MFYMRNFTFEQDLQADLLIKSKVNYPHCRWAQHAAQRHNADGDLDIASRSSNKEDLLEMHIEPSFFRTSLFELLPRVHN